MSKLYIELAGIAVGPAIAPVLVADRTPRAALLIFLLRLALWFLTESLGSRVPWSAIGTGLLA